MRGGTGLIAAGLAAVVLAAAGALLLQGDATEQPSYSQLEAVEAPGAKVREARVKRGRLGQFSQINRRNARLFADRGRRHEGAPSIRAMYLGGGANGYARGVFNVSWRPGDVVAYGGSFYLPTALFDSLDGQLALMRWDDFPRRPRETAHGGVVVNESDRRAYLVAEQLGGGGQTQLIGPFDLPRDRWFRLEVSQRLGTGDALSEVRLDGQVVGQSTAANMTSERRPRRIRYGIVAIDAGAQRRPLRLWFDRATASRAPR